MFHESFLQQRLRLLQIFRVKSFGEPVVDLGQQSVSFVSLPCCCHRRARLIGGAQFQRLGLLALSDLNGFEKTRFGFDSDWVLGVGMLLVGDLLDSDFGLWTVSVSSPLSRYSSASYQRSPVLSTIASASASTLSPSSACPTFPYASASRAR